MTIFTSVTTLPITQKTNITEPPISIVSTTTNNVTSAKQEAEVSVTTELTSGGSEEDLSNANITISQQDHLTNVTEVTKKSLLPNNITSEDNTILNDNLDGEGNQNETKLLITDGDALVMGQEVAEHSEFIVTQPLRHVPA